MNHIYKISFIWSNISLIKFSKRHFKNNKFKINNVCANNLKNIVR